MSENYDQSVTGTRNIKAIMIGEGGVGKSWILSCFANDRPPDDHIRPTVGIDFKMKDMVVDNIRCKLQVWDTSGDPTYLSITNSYLPNAANIVLVYDVTLLASFTKLLEHWIPEIERSCRTEVQIMLIGNKCDAPSDQREISTEEGRAFAQELGIPFFEVSATTGENITEMFTQLVSNYLRDHPIDTPTASASTTVVNTPPPPPPGITAAQAVPTPVARASTTAGRHARIIRMLLAGDGFVGKSALITSYVDNEFHESSHQTIGVDFKSKEIPVPPTGTPCKLQIWDIAGNVRFRTITTAYFRGSVIIYLVYDISDADSFNHITSEWLPLVRSNATRTVELMLIGNKCDIRPGRRAVSTEEGQSLATQLGIPFLEVSALDKTNLDQMFESMATKYIETYPEAPPAPTPTPEEVVPTQSNSQSLTNSDSMYSSFVDFRPDSFLQEMLERPVSSLQEIIDRLYKEHKLLIEKVKALEKEKQRLLSIAPVPSDNDSLCVDLQDALAVKTELQKRVDVLEAKESVLKGYEVNELETLEEQLRESLRRVETRKVILQERQNTLCVICLSQPKSIVLMACSHLCLCESCLNQSGASLTECPVCQKTITGTLKVFS